MLPRFQQFARIYDAVRAGIIYQAGLHYDMDGHREFVHSETGVRTLKAEFDKVASHSEHHLEHRSNRR